MIKFDNNGAREWASHYDYVWSSAVDIDNSDNFYVTGNVEYNTPNTKTLTGAYNQSSISLDGTASGNSDDGFIMKFNSSTTLLWATCFGGSSDEFINSIDVGSDGYINIVSSVDNYYGSGIVTQSAGGYYDITIGSRMDILISRFNSNHALVWSTLYGGSANEGNSPWGNVIQTDGNNNIYVTGSTRSTDNTLMNPGGGAYYDGTLNGTENMFLLKFNSSTSLIWGTYIGESVAGSVSSCLRLNDNDELIFYNCC